MNHEKPQVFLHKQRQFCTKNMKIHSNTEQKETFKEATGGIVEAQNG